MYKTILVPIDVSEDDLTELVISHVNELQKISGASVHFLAVTAPISTYFRYGRTMIPTDFPDDEKQAEAMAKELKQKIKLFSIPEDKIHSYSSIGSVKDCILDTAEKINADLIILGSRRPSMSTYLLGSNAASVVRYAKTSVMIIR